MFRNNRILVTSAPNLLDSRARTFASLRIEHANYKHNYAQGVRARATCSRIKFTHHWHTVYTVYTNAIYP